MSLQKKCLTASAVTHGLLLVLVFIGSAFIPQKPKIEGPEFELVDIPEMLVAEPNVVSGGDPNAGRPQPPVQPQPPAPVTPVPEQPKPKINPQQIPVEPPKEAPKPKEIKPEPVKPLEPKPEPRKTLDPDAFDFNKTKTITKAEPKTVKPETAFDLNKAKKITVKPVETAKSGQAERESSSAAAARQAAQASQLLANAMKAVSGTGGRVGINPDAIFGPGGKAQMSYHLAVATIYEREFKRHPVPSRGTDPAVEVEVTVRRDGTIVGTRVTRPSSRAEFNRAVDAVRAGIKRVPPFPADLSGDTITIKINFNLDISSNG